MSFAARSYFIPQFKGCDIALSLGSPPYIAAYSWSNGFGNKYPDPDPPLEYGVNFIQFHPDGNYLVLGSNSLIYPRSLVWNTDTGFGALQQPTYFTNLINDLRFSSSGKYLGLATRQGQQSGYLILWTNTESGFGQRFITRTNNLDEDPAATITGSSVDISPDERYLVFTSTITTSRMPRAYPISESGFGTRLPSPNPTFGSFLVRFSPKGDVVYFANLQSPAITAYTFNDGFGTKFSDPIGEIAQKNVAYSLSIAPDGKSIAFMTLTGSVYEPFVLEWNNGFGARYSNPPSLPASPNTNTIRFSPSGNEVAFGLDSSPYIHVYSWSNNSGFGLKFADPIAAVPSSVGSIAWKAP
jgi:hypothetical protein